MTDTVKIYVPTPTEKGGVAEVTARPARFSEGAFESVTSRTHFSSCYANKKWFLDRDKALAVAEAERVKRIASLKHQIEKLEKIGPFVDVEG